MKNNMQEDMTSDIFHNNDESRYISTEAFAKRNFVKPASVRSRYCFKGSYFGTVPKKLKNGKLAWPIMAHVTTIQGKGGA